MCSQGNQSIYTFQDITVLRVSPQLVLTIELWIKKNERNMLFCFCKTSYKRDMIRNDKIQMILYNVNLVILFLFFFQFFDFPNKLVFIWTLAFYILFVIVWKKFFLDYRDIFLFLGMLFYALLAKKSFNSTVSIVLLPVMLSFLGKSMAYCALETEQKQWKVENLVFALVAGYFLHGLLNSFIYFWQCDLLKTRSWMDVWTGNILPATQQNIFIIPIFSLLVPFFLYYRQNIKACIGVFFLVLYNLFFSVLSASRIPILIFIIVVGWEIFLFFIFNRKKERNEKTARVLSFLGIIVLVIILLGIFLWSSNFGNIKNSIFISIFKRDGGILGNIRFRAQLMAIKQLFKYPLGGYRMDLAGLSLVHNVWLDIANASGLIPFALFLGYTLISIWDLMVLLRNRTICQFDKSILSGLYLTFVLYYMVEPALEANIQYLLPWFFLNGLICIYSKAKI